MQELNVTILQTDALPDKTANLDHIDQMIDGSTIPPGLIALPEVFASRGNSEDYRTAAESIPGPTTERLGAAAARSGSLILAGSIVESEESDVFNTSVLIDQQGKILAKYRKLHLFEATLDDGTVIKESDDYSPGQSPVAVDIQGWKCGMSICYDLRFPELYRHYSAQGAAIMFVPSNFTQRTGRDHWEILLRARAIENQCFIIAPNLCGTNRRTAVASHGHSMVVGPWGKVLCSGKNVEAVLTTTIRPEELTTTRGRIPVLEHRHAALTPAPLGRSARADSEI